MTIFYMEMGKKKKEGKNIKKARRLLQVARETQKRAKPIKAHLQKMKQAQKICPRIPHLKRKMLSFENGSKNVRGFQ